MTKRTVHARLHTEKEQEHEKPSKPDEMVTDVLHWDGPYFETEQQTREFLARLKITWMAKYGSTFDEERWGRTVERHVSRFQEKK